METAQLVLQLQLLAQAAILDGFWLALFVTHLVLLLFIHMFQQE